MRRKRHSKPLLLTDDERHFLFSAGDKNLLLDCGAQGHPRGRREAGTGSEQVDHATREGAVSSRHRCGVRGWGAWTRQGRAEGQPTFPSPILKRLTNLAFHTDFTRFMQAFVPAMQACLASPEHAAAMPAFRAEQAAKSEEKS